MAVNLEKQTMSLNKVVARNTQVNWIEQDILVPDTKPDVMKIIQVEAIPFIANEEVIDGGIRVTGDTTYYIIYRAMDNDITKGISMTYPFTQTINVKEARKGMHANVNVTTRNVIYSLPNERKVSIKTELVFRYTLREVANIEFVQGVKEGSDNIESQSLKDVFYNVIDVKQEIIDVKEDVVIPESMPKISEILRVSTNISNSEYKISYNKILVKGDINIELLYLSTNDTRNVYTYTTSIPFTGMIEFSNISENSRFDIKYTMRNLEIVLSSTDNSMLNISAEVIADVIMFEEREVSYINDFYSTNNNLSYDKSEVVVIKNKESIEKQVAVKDTIGSIDMKSKIVSSRVETEHLNSKVAGGNLYIDGPLKVTVITSNNETSALDSKTYDVLVDTTIPLGKEVDEQNVDVEITVLSKSILSQNDSIEANIVLKIVANIENIDKITIIGEIEQTSINDNDFDSMYMYIVRKGDTLWDIAKRYKTTVDKIANINNIVDENKLDIGQKLLIIR